MVTTLKPAAHLATGRCDAHDGQRMRRCEVLRLEGDRLTVRPVSGGEAFTRSVWSVRFVDRAKGQALRKAVRESVPREEWTGVGRQR